MERIRVATLQYFIRPVASFKQFAHQVEALVETAKDYRCRLVVFPEYFSTQLLTLGDVRRPIVDQIRDLANQEDNFIELLAGLARKYGVYIVAGTVPGWDEGRSEIFNRCHVFGPTGTSGIQSKLHMTRFESEEWHVSSGKKLRIFEADFGKFAVNICYDVEFPEIARAAAKQGVRMIVVPSCTDDRMGYLRVRYCAQARCIENQIYVVHSGTVGSLPQVPAISLNYGQAAIYTPCDYPFARDGILAEGNANQETIVIGELDFRLIDEARTNGTVLPLRDSQRTSELLDVTEFVTL